MGGHECARAGVCEQERRGLATGGRGEVAVEEERDNEAMACRESRLDEAGGAAAGVREEMAWEGELEKKGVCRSLKWN